MSMRLQFYGQKSLKNQSTVKETEEISKVKWSTAHKKYLWDRK